MKRAFSVALCCALAACGGGGGGSPAPPTVTASARAAVQIKIVVPSVPASASANLRRAMSAAASTKGALFTIYAHGGNSSSPIVQTAVDLTATGGNCTPSGTGRTCTVTFQAPTGNTNDLLVQTIDAAPVNGVISTGNVLSAGTLANINVVAGQANSFSLTLNPVVNAVSLSTTPAFLHTLYPSPTHPAFTVNLNALDADGNIIISGAYVDLTGNPVSIPLSIANNPNTSLALSASSVNGSGTLITGTYNGAADTAANTTTSVTIQAGGAFSASTTLKMIAPTMTTHALVHAVLPSGSAYYGAAYLPTASGNQVWIVDTDPALTTGGIETYDIATQTVNPVEAGSAGNVLEGGIVGGATTSGQGAYTGGTTTPELKAYTPSVGSLGAATCAGSCASIASNLSYDSSMLDVAWVSGTTLAAYNTTTQTASPLTTVASSSVTGLAYDGSNNIWYCDPTGPTMNEWNGSTASPLTVSSCFDVIWDGTNMWFSDPANGSVESLIDPISAIGIQWFTNGGTPRYLAADTTANLPGVFATYTTASGIGIARFDGTSQYLAEATLSTSGGQAGPVVVSPTGDRIYVVHYTSTGGELMEIIP
ncbi:MAG TPA: hypothetical protein VFN49_11700 [Candidatus Aquilonibacter sp.]|nr:hypothetical protein [Candidatus Aquilonibacter sp.]